MPVLAITGAPLLATPQAFAVGIYMVLVPMFLGYLLFGYGLSKLPASTATTITLTEPAVATVLAVLVVGERLTTAGWTGLALIAAVLVILAVAPTHTGQTGRDPQDPCTGGRGAGRAAEWWTRACAVEPRPSAHQARPESGPRPRATLADEDPVI
jgi:peptidoglycan/LPS O-acetylase OafA/YrhL